MPLIPYLRKKAARFYIVQLFHIEELLLDIVNSYLAVIQYAKMSVSHVSLFELVHQLFACYQII